MRGQVSLKHASERTRGGCLISHLSVPSLRGPPGKCLISHLSNTCLRRPRGGCLISHLSVPSLRGPPGKCLISHLSNTCLRRPPGGCLISHLSSRDANGQRKPHSRKHFLAGLILMSLVQPIRSYAARKSSTMQCILTERGYPEITKCIALC